MLATSFDFDVCFVLVYYIVVFVVVVVGHSTPKFVKRRQSGVERMNWRRFGKTSNQSGNNNNNPDDEGNNVPFYGE